MARAFVKDRGKAISLATLGHPLGEASLPLLMAFVIGSLGWRAGLRLSALSFASAGCPADLIVVA
jgi:sugar phosphate permease